MMDLLDYASAVLRQAGFSVRLVPSQKEPGFLQKDVLVFEDDTVLGFVLAYEAASELLEKWEFDGEQAALKLSKELSAAQQKAWNAYLVLLAREPADFGQALAMGQIEENLQSMRKITRAGVQTRFDAKDAFLPLLSFSSAPMLEPINMEKEILARTSDLPRNAIEAFLSDADESLIIQLLEDQE